VKKLSQTSPGGVVLVPELVLLGQAAPWCNVAWTRLLSGPELTASMMSISPLAAHTTVRLVEFFMVLPRSVPSHKRPGPAGTRLSLCVAGPAEVRDEKHFRPAPRRKLSQSAKVVEAGPASAAFG
jgi:hypothetical protein